jgi:Kdo2-lipid IVA lauroyltransferase/acyltransferase
MYYLLFAILYPLSLLPLRVLFLISDILYLTIYKVLGYRVAVTRANLEKSFPEKSKNELRSIEQKFYKNLCDSIVETIKLLSISKQQLNKRMTANWDVINDEYGKGKVVQGHLSHLFNWEWGTVVCNWNTPFQFVGPYNKLSSKSFERLMLRIRKRSGTEVIDMDTVQQHMASYQSKETLWGFVADQNPSEPRRSAWVNFLGRETAFFKGAELIARRYNNIVIFGRVVKLRRGYYNIELTKVLHDGGDTKDGDITEMYVRFLEECIRLQPENWLWSHRRWKHVRPPQTR